MSQRIVIIEDDPDILYIIEVILQEEGFETQSSLIGLSAEALIAINPDLIILDVRLEGSKESGSQICAKLKANPSSSGIPIVLVSAENNLKSIANDCGANDWLSKPFQIDNLIKKVKDLLS